MTHKCYDFDQNGRCLISPAYGCQASCTYCYCNRPKQIVASTSQSIINSIIHDDNYQQGQTIISLGCYTECLASDLLKTTLELIDYFLSKDHIVSISTKQNPSVLARVNKKNKNFFVFISCPTLSYWEKFETGTAPPCERFSACPNLKAVGINTVLYIKPYLHETAIDLDSFIHLCSAYKLEAVVGRPLNVMGNGQEVRLIGRTYHEECSPDYDKFVAQMSQKINVYQNSIEVLAKRLATKNKE